MTTATDQKPDWWKLGGKLDCRSGVGHSGHPDSPGPNYEGPHIAHVVKVLPSDDLEMRCDCGHEWTIPVEHAPFLVDKPTRRQQTGR